MVLLVSWIQSGLSLSAPWWLVLLVAVVQVPSVPWVSVVQAARRPAASRVQVCRLVPEVCWRTRSLV
jgi:hypothetical protein